MKILIILLCTRARACGARIDARIKINSVRQKAEISHQKDFPSR